MIKCTFFKYLNKHDNFDKIIHILLESKHLNKYSFHVLLIIINKFEQKKKLN